MLWQERFAESDEARLSYVSLGELLLREGRAQDAEHQFAAYLARPGGELTEEAMVGRAESLLRLGHKDASATLWRELLREFPASVYAAEARKKIVEADSP